MQSHRESQDLLGPSLRRSFSFLSFQENAHFAEGRVGPNLFPEPETFDERCRPKRAFLRHVPIVQTGSLSQSITCSAQVAMGFEVIEVIFDQQQPGSMASQIKTAKDVELCAFDIHRDKIDCWVSSLGQDGIERCDFYHLRSDVIRGRVDQSVYQYGMAGGFRGKKSHLGRRARGAAGSLKYLRPRTSLPKAFAKPGLRFDQNAAPAALFKEPCLRTLLRFIGA